MHKTVPVRQFHVGGVTFSIRAVNEALLHPVPENHYQDFEHENIPEKVDIDLLINTASLDNIPGINEKLIYSSESSWSLYRLGNEYIIRLQPSGHDLPMWEARANGDFSEVTVHVNVREGHEKDQLQELYPCRYPLDQVLLMHYLATREGIIIHSAGVVINKKGYIFPGISGAGKSTISTTLCNHAQCRVVNDDRMIIRKDNNSFLAHGTPWPGEAGIATNSTHELDGIFFLNKATENRIEEVSPQAAFEKLMPVTSIPWHHKEMVDQLFTYCENIVREIPVYNLFFTPSESLGDLICETVC